MTASDSDSDMVLGYIRATSQLHAVADAHARRLVGEGFSCGGDPEQSATRSSAHQRGRPVQRTDLPLRAHDTPTFVSWFVADKVCCVATNESI